MHQIAVLFRTAPLELGLRPERSRYVLACSALTDEVALFFLGDGVFQLASGQQPAGILGRDYAPTFKLLALYDIEQVYYCRVAAGAGVKPGAVVDSGTSHQPPGSPVPAAGFCRPSGF